VIIVWKNATRHDINRLMRRIRGAPGWAPIARDRIVFYETDRDLGVYNGLGATVDEILNVTQFGVHMRVLTDASEFRTIIARPEPFRGETLERRGRRDPDAPIHVEYAYAITCHKSQGSEWPSVYVVDDTRAMANKLGAVETRRWLYTAVTRTSDKLTIMR